MDWTGLRDPLYALLCSTCKSKSAALFLLTNLFYSSINWTSQTVWRICNLRTKLFKLLSNAWQNRSKRNGFFLFPPGFTVPELEHFDAEGRTKSWIQKCRDIGSGPDSSRTCIRQIMRTATWSVEANSLTAPGSVAEPKISLSAPAPQQRI